MRESLVEVSFELGLQDFKRQRYGDKSINRLSIRNHQTNVLEGKPRVCSNKSKQQSRARIETKRSLKLGKFCEAINMSVDISEDGMERSIKHGLKSLQKMRSILEVSRYRPRKWCYLPSKQESLQGGSNRKMIYK